MSLWHTSNSAGVRLARVILASVSHPTVGDLREIGKSDIVQIVDETLRQGAPSAANHALATIRLFFNWCFDRGLVDNNPCDRLKAPAKKIARDRVLDDVEIAKVWHAASSIGYPYGTISQLLLLTAQRRN
jgi:site-specific recombinase XerD